ncbi:MAG TPA: hypothetical protein PLD51_05690 [Pontiellaceae bacterium]|nr:hypothetical protein [Pontiellaceae bacterium]HPR83334.1 hypothetical protein [Pontiellaceae bacterium]
MIVSNNGKAYNPRLMHIIFKNGLAAAKKNIGPGLLLQGFALALLLLYYFHAPTRQLLMTIPEIKARMGISFPLLMTAFSGGILPFIFLAFRKEIPAGRYIPHLLFLTGFWAFNGMMVDLLYQGQALLFGDQADFATLIKKITVDQFVFCPLYSAPVTAVAMHWKNCDFSWQKTKAELSARVFAFEMLSVLISIWGVWLPTVFILYSLPLALQFPLFNIILCFWSLLLSALNSKPQSA